MKTLLLILSVISFTVNAQDSISERRYAYEAPLDSSICVERGHVWSDLMSTTLMYCGDPYIVDEEDASYMVYPRCNYHTRKCLRCGVVEQYVEEDVRVKIWEKPKVDTAIFYVPNLDTLWYPFKPYINLNGK